MGGIICDGSIVCVMVILLIFSFSGMSIVPFIFNSNIIAIMMLVVVSSILTFVVYYIGNDVSNDAFKLLKIMFLRLMVFILNSYGLVMFIG